MLNVNYLLEKIETKNSAPMHCGIQTRDLSGTKSIDRSLYRTYSTGTMQYIIIAVL